MDLFVYIFFMLCPARLVVPSAASIIPPPELLIPCSVLCPALYLALYPALSALRRPTQFLSTTYLYCMYARPRAEFKFSLASVATVAISSCSLIDGEFKLCAPLCFCTCFSFPPLHTPCLADWLYIARPTFLISLEPSPSERDARPRTAIPLSG
ncbi:hypothetical protein LX36DRAFT_177159 [Colletotrichum falcatum]|nr:hypothetical protein LX36DRAFT_177159 [Colletotrichum falcatum]